MKNNRVPYAKPTIRVQYLTIKCNSILVNHQFNAYWFGFLNILQLSQSDPTHRELIAHLPPMLIVWKLNYILESQNLLTDNINMHT